ncbi:MAG: patatin-like phospholipase family protein [Chloroflexi bacterium]|nr:patatin-like phospholipase family protein [Chloroflexota bacterium]
MKPFRERVAIAIDGGGIRGVVVARALAILEDHLGRSAHEIFRLTAGTSTGSVIAAGIAAGLTGAQMHRLYTELGHTIFRRTWRSWLWPLTRYRYPFDPLKKAIREQIGDLKMGDFWSADPPTDVVITAFDLVTNHTRFIKPWKPEYANWPVVKAVLASSSVPTYFPPIDGRYVDGGVGAYTNPCYLAAYELVYVLGWDPAETTLISLGTGRNPHTFAPGDANRLWAWQWVKPILGAFLQSADDQQVHLVSTFFQDLDFRRFQVDLREPIEMDDPSKIPQLTAYGDELGRKILNDETDPALDFRIMRAPSRL